MSLLEDCVCTGPGYCERYKVHMSGRPLHLCQNKCPPTQPCPPENRREALLLHMLGLPAPLVVESRESTYKPEEWPPGPGTQAIALLKELSIEVTPSCACKARARLMNHWGVAECKKRREEIASWFREAAKNLNWSPAIKAACKLIWKTQAKREFRLNVLSPYLSITDEAIRRAEEEESESAANVNHPK